MQALVRYAVGLLLLTCLHLACTWLLTRLHIPFPGSLLGLVLLAVLLRAGVIPLPWVEGTANTLLKHLPLLYLPVVAGLGQYWPLLRDSGLGLVPTLLITTGLVFITTGLTAQRLRPRKEQPHVDLLP